MGRRNSQHVTCTQATKRQSVPFKQPSERLLSSSHACNLWTYPPVDPTTPTHPKILPHLIPSHLTPFPTTNQSSFHTYHTPSLPSNHPFKPTYRLQLSNHASRAPQLLRQVISTSIKPQSTPPPHAPCDGVVVVHLATRIFGALPVGRQLLLLGRRGWWRRRLLQINDLWVV